jgi:hypothetical protein
VTDPAARELARTIEDLQRRVRALSRTGQLGNTSIEGGTLTVFDAAGQVRTLIGVQPDNTVTITDHNGPPPPTPGAFFVQAYAGMAAVTWYGEFAEDYRADGTYGPAVRPSDFKHVEIHASQTSGYVQSDETQVGTLTSVRGSTVMVPLGDGEWFISLQAVSTSGAESATSAEVAVTPLPIEAPVRFFQDTREVAYGGYDSYKVPLTYVPVADSEHVYWNGMYQEDARWDRSGVVVTVPDTDRRIKGGDRLTVEYAHRDLPGTPEFNPITFIRCGGVAMYGGTSALPAGTQIGDTIIVATCGREKGYITAGADQFNAEMRVDIGDADGSRLHIGIVKRLDPIGVMMGNQDGARSNEAVVWTTRAALDGRFNKASSTGVAQFAVPAPAGRGSGYLAIMLNKGGIGGGYSGWNFENADNLADWNRSCSSGTYHNIASGWTQASQLDPSGVLITVRNNQWANGFLFGLQL